MAYKALCFVFVTLVMMAVFIPPNECIPIDKDDAIDLKQTFAKNSTTIIKQGNASQVLEALGLLSGIGKGEDGSHNLTEPMEIEINIISFNMSALQIDSSDYDSNDDSDDYRDYQSDEPRGDGYFDLRAAFGDHDSEEDETQGEEREMIPIDRIQLDDLANEMITFAACIKIYEKHITNVNTKPITDPKLDDGNDKPRKVLIDGSEVMNVIAQCKIFMTKLQQIHDQLVRDHQRSEEAKLPDVGHEVPRPIPSTQAIEQKMNEWQQHPKNLMPHKSATEVPSPPCADALHPHTGSKAKMPKKNVSERRKDTDVDHTERISASDEAAEDCDEDKDSSNAIFIIITFYASTLLASFLLGIVFEKYRQDCIQSRDIQKLYLVPGQSALLKLSKEHDKKIIIKA
ncbi:unnamed protein product [Orchesella dallaii]|uniref:Uncharacterized protein n=1 Tax=Orchesella dallaii TaxID=48710 RepID=A0ABP1QP51_9HEXA